MELGGRARSLARSRRRARCARGTPRRSPRRAGPARAGRAGTARGSRWRGRSGARRARGTARARRASRTTGSCTRSSRAAGGARGAGARVGRSRARGRASRRRPRRRPRQVGAPWTSNLVDAPRRIRHVTRCARRSQTRGAGGRARRCKSRPCHGSAVAVTVGGHRVAGAPEAPLVARAPQRPASRGRAAPRGSRPAARGSRCTTTTRCEPSVVVALGAQHAQAPVVGRRATRSPGPRGRRGAAPAARGTAR